MTVADLSDLLLLKARRPPVIVASEAAECGLACLAMIGRYHGHDIDLNTMRARFTLSMAGITLRRLMAVADQLQFQSRALRVELEDLAKVPTPAVLHWDLNHFVVLVSAGPRRIVVHDPGFGARRLSLREASKHFTGVVLEVQPRPDFIAVEDRLRMRLRALWAKSSGMPSAAFQVVLLSILLQFAAFVGPFYIQLVTDQAIARGDASILGPIAIGFALVAVLQTGLSALRNWMVQMFGNMLTIQLVGNIVAHLLRLPANFFEKRHLGDIISRVSSTDTIQESLSQGLLSTMIDGVMAVTALAIMSLYSPLLTIIVVAAVTANLVLTTCIYPALRLKTEEELIASAIERTHLMESVRASTTIKIMGREAEREGRWRNLFVDVVNSRMSLARYRIGSDALQSLITALAAVAVIYLGATFVIAQQGFTVGMLLAFLAFRQTFTDRTTSLLVQVSQLRLLGLHLDRVGDIVLCEREAASLPVQEWHVAGAIRLRDVSFRYSDADPFVLRDVDLDIAPGEFVAITGLSGGGKTTLLKIMLGLHAPTRGMVLLDGQTGSQSAYRQWREQVGVVSQEDRLLSGSIADNIAFFDPELDMARVQRAAETAQIHGEIMRMPMRYLSLVGDMGSTLSGGQKQRIILARALYRSPRVLVLDEGTANLDRHTEDVIADIVAALDITRIVVAHRPALIERADRVVTVADTHVLPGSKDGARWNEQAACWPQTPGER